MKKQFFLLLFAAGMYCSFAQQNVLSSGNDNVSSSGKSTYSVGLIHYKEATGSGGSSSAGTQIPFEVLEVLSIPESELISVKVFPNPAKSFINIDFASQSQYNYRLIDLSGRKVFDGVVSQYSKTIRLESLDASIYILNLYNDSNSLIKSYKISKQ